MSSAVLGAALTAVVEATSAVLFGTPVAGSLASAEALTLCLIPVPGGGKGRFILPWVAFLSQLSSEFLEDLLLSLRLYTTELNLLAGVEVATAVGEDAILDVAFPEIELLLLVLVLNAAGDELIASAFPLVVLRSFDGGFISFATEAECIVSAQLLPLMER